MQRNPIQYSVIYGDHKIGIAFFKLDFHGSRNFKAQEVWAQNYKTRNLYEKLLQTSLEISPTEVV